jgi:hypothetical protein
MQAPLTTTTINRINLFLRLLASTSTQFLGDGFPHSLGLSANADGLLNLEPSNVGIPPSRLFLETFRYTRPEICARLTGICPLKLLVERSKDVKLDKLDNESGMLPER